MELYPFLKHLHVTCVVLTAGGFVLRGIWMLRASPLLHHPLTRVLPHVNDTLLLAAGVGLLWGLSWLMLKLVPDCPWL